MNRRLLKAARRAPTVEYFIAEVLGRWNWYRKEIPCNWTKRELDFYYQQMKGGK